MASGILIITIYHIKCPCVTSFMIYFLHIRILPYSTHIVLLFYRAQVRLHISTRIYDVLAFLISLTFTGKHWRRCISAYLLHEQRHHQGQQSAFWSGSGAKLSNRRRYPLLYDLLSWIWCRLKIFPGFKAVSLKAHKVIALLKSCYEHTRLSVAVQQQLLRESTSVNA